MKLLLDTHSLLWSLLDDEKLAGVRELIKNPSNEIYVSVASLWEIEIKHSVHPEAMPYSSEEISKVINDKADFVVLPIEQSHITSLGEIINQGIHKDPFDHLLLAVAKANNMVLLTHDDKINQYHGVNILFY
ncbi:MAG: type II toxin-antitoxin system VapC family toxin [Bacilli bacterium]|nr:type II toxin-antitoxin system VapC family toxin [Bacilli bacterium]